MIGKEAALISDTVGFINKLPAYMIEAFKSTLEELLYADTILVLIDANDELYQLEKKLKNCFRILSEIGVEPNKMIFVLNKSESLSDDKILSKANYLKFNENKKWVAISAITGKNINKLEKLVDEYFQNNILENKNDVSVKAYGN